MCCSIGGARSEPLRDPLVVDSSVAEHYKWGGTNDGWYLVDRNDLQVIQELVVPGGKEVPHFHRKSRQVFFVLSGSLTIKMGGIDHKVGSRQLIEVPPGTPHQALNETNSTVEMIVFSMPPSHQDRVDLP